MLKAPFQLTNVHVLNMKTRSSFLVNQNPASTKVLKVTLLEAHLSFRPKNNGNVLLQRSKAGPQTNQFKAGSGSTAQLVPFELLISNQGEC